MTSVVVSSNILCGGGFRLRKSFSKLGDIFPPMGAPTLILSAIHDYITRPFKGFMYMDIDGHRAVRMSYDQICKKTHLRDRDNTYRTVRILETMGVLISTTLNPPNGKREFKDCNHKYYRINYELVKELLDKGREYAKECWNKAKEAYKIIAREFVRARDIAFEIKKSIKGMTNKMVQQLKSSSARFENFYKKNKLVDSFKESPEQTIAIDRLNLSNLSMKPPNAINKLFIEIDQNLISDDQKMLLKRLATRCLAAVTHHKDLDIQRYDLQKPEWIYFDFAKGVPLQGWTIIHKDKFEEDYYRCFYDDFASVGIYLSRNTKHAP